MATLNGAEITDSGPAYKEIRPTIQMKGAVGSQSPDSESSAGQSASGQSGGSSQDTGGSSSNLAVEPYNSNAGQHFDTWSDERQDRISRLHDLNRDLNVFNYHDAKGTHDDTKEN